MCVVMCSAQECLNYFLQNNLGRKRLYCSGACSAKVDYYRHQSRRLALKKAYGERNRPGLAKKSRTYRQLNQEQTNASSRRWHRENPERSRQRGIKRYIHKLGTQAEVRFSEREWGTIKSHWNFKCAYCGAKPQTLTQDHIVPLSKGGPHTADNIVPACQPCNSKKGDKDLIQFLIEKAA